MKTTSKLAPWIAALAVAITAVVDAAPTAQDATIPVAHSVLLTVDATRTPDGLALHVKHAGNHIPIDGQDVKVAVDGKEQLITPQAAGTILLSTQNLTAGERRIDVTVGHDGIHETLTGTIAVSKANSGAGSGLSGSHSQMAWWILNVVIVLIAVLAISNRKPRAEDKEDDDEAE